MVIEAYYGQVAEEIVSNFQSGEILDLGTGPGYLPIEIVRRAPDITIIGVDLSRKLIQMAQANAAKSGLSHQLRFEVGNSAGLRFDDGVFDMVISTGMLHSLKNPVAVLKEIYRVLKNGSVAWIYDPANVTPYIDKKKWKASLNIRERSFLWFFKLLGLHNPIAAYTREQVIPEPPFPLLEMHYRYRFDPAGISAGERHRLEEGVKTWLAEAGKNAEV